MSEQKIAVVGRIMLLTAIADADRILKADVDCGDAGQWVGVVGLDHQAGDLVTVFLQDAVLPPDERWEFMSRHKHRVRMARFKGVPSECVIIKGAPELPVGTDLAEALGVTKYSKPLPVALAGAARGNFPSFIDKTDEPNFQTVRVMLNKLMQGSWVASLKCDGTSCTAWNDDITGVLRVASRNLELNEFTDTGAGNVYWQTARKYRMEHLPFGTALQFEVVGPGIQGNPMGLDQVQGFAFTLQNFKSRARCGQFELAHTAKLVGMDLAPLVSTSDCCDPLSNDDWRELAQVKYPNGKHGEGIVIRSLDHKLSLKVINLLYKD